MDSFDEILKTEQRRKRTTRIFIGICIPLLVILILGSVLVYANNTAVEVRLNGASEIVLEYGEFYSEPGAEAVFTGRFYPSEDQYLDISTEGTVDAETLGNYIISYSAEEHLWKDSQKRIVRVVDSQPPQIQLVSNPGSYTLPGRAYDEEGFSAWDNYDGDITHKVQSTEKDGIVTYQVEDSSGNRTEVTREIVYDDPIPPVLMMIGEGNISMLAGDPFVDPGFTAMDNGTDISDQVTVSGTVNTYRVGTYTLSYYVEDSYGNHAGAQRTVEVKARTQPKPVTPDGKVIYLTFDDGPGPYTAMLLEVLKKYDVKATFFVCNTDCVDYIKDIADGGHSIGIHAESHDYKKIYASEEAYFSDLFQMQGIIEEKTGIRTTLVRFPGGSSNTVSSFNEGIMTRLAQCLTDMGFQYFDWNVDSDDAGNAKTAKKVLENVIEGIGDRKFSIVLQHDVKDFSVEAVEDIICWGLENGYVFLALDETSPAVHHNIRN